MLDAIVADLRFAARGLRRSPGFTAAAVLTLALGIGATTAVFSVVYGIMFRPLPFPNADRLVQVVQLLPQRPGATERSRAGLTPDQIAEWRATSRTLAKIGHYFQAEATLTDVATPVRLNGAGVAVPLFQALGVQPIKGRAFVDADEQTGNEQVVILNYDTWVTRFASADEVLDTSLTLNARPFRIIGVMPQGFGFPSLASASMSLNSAGELSDAPEFWTPMVARARPAGPITSGGLTLVPTFALLRPGVSLEQATAEANTLMAARANERWPVELVSARVEQTRAVRPVLLVFQAAVMFVLFIACVNVVNLLLARSAVRRQELIIRLALGASRAQIARYAIAESVLIGAAGGLLGCALAYQLVALFRTLPPFLLPRMVDVRVDAVVLLAASVVSVVAGVLVGAAAAWRTLRAEKSERTAAWTPRTATAGRRQRPSQALLVAETAAGIILLAGAGLLLTSFVRLTNVERGFDPSEVTTFRVSLPARDQAAVAQQSFHREFAPALRQIPGVTSVGASDRLPGQAGIGFKLVIDKQTINAPIAFNVIAPGVFATLGIPLQGRDISERDYAVRAAVVIANQTFARQYFGDQSPIGRHIQFQDWADLEIIGVAGDTRTGDLKAAIRPALYLPQETQGRGFAVPTYVVRGTRDVAAVRAAAARVEPNAVVFDATPLDALLARTVTAPRVYGATAAGFAAVAVLLAALGLYGVLAYSVGSQTRELGIRMVLGATPRAVIVKVMREALATVLTGVTLGVIGALYLSRFLTSLLFGVAPGDAATLAAVVALFLVVAALACYIPARRATSVDPAFALRAD